ncbi:MAG: 1-deoxy-D-xylulose-5-phosphate synthase [Clostridiales bacterium]|nr:1-deoxy-D-xylulose-5-phosphate synthase [Clostridiales bacterium]
MNNILDNVNHPNDIKRLEKSQMAGLCADIRGFLLENVSKTGGHLASNLGVVELTVALHRVFDPTKDRILFDVGHQSYVHKILTGRKDGFKTLRKFGGMSGFPKPNESDCDPFIAGHASDAISLALGMARARTLTKADYCVIAVIGDGALTGGLAYEGLNSAGQSGEPMIVILNDNGMSITRNVGGISTTLARQRTKPGYYNFKKVYRKVMKKIPGGDKLYAFNHKIKTAIKKAVINCSFFEEMGFHYLGPVDGHDVNRLTDMLEHAKTLNEPVLMHVVTKKGKGYTPAEQNPDAYHGVAPFDLKKGVEDSQKKSFSIVFGEKLCELAENDERICAITAAMKSGTGLSGFAERFPKRFFDEGIAEGHSASMAAGMAKQGLIPVFAVYSTFLQRSYDMLLHDIAILRQHVVLAVDRAGIVGADGETHQGVFDVSYLRSVPDMRIYSPASFAELRDMLEAAVHCTGPVAVRYPRGAEGNYTDGGSDMSKLVREGNDVTLVCYGTIVNQVLSAAELLSARGISAGVLKLGVIKPIDYDAIITSVRKTGRIAVIEESMQTGAVGEAVLAKLAQDNITAEALLINLGDGFVPHGSVDKLLEACGLGAKGIADKLSAWLQIDQRMSNDEERKT